MPLGGYRGAEHSMRETPNTFHRSSNVFVSVFHFKYATAAIKRCFISCFSNCAGIIMIL